MVGRRGNRNPLKSNMTASITGADAAATQAAATSDAPILMTYKSTGKALQCSRATVRRLIEDGKLRTVTLSARAVRIVGDDVRALAA